MSNTSKIICVIPALNAAASLPATIAGLEGVACLVADGGSTDDTCAVVESLGAGVVTGAPGRGQQLIAGADAALAQGADWLLFLHADTRLEASWCIEAQAFMDDPDNLYRAAVFRFHLDEQTAPARRLERLVDWRSRALALPYGDQGLLMSKDFYQLLGGFRPLELMEDVDMIRRIGGKRLAFLTAFATTSAGKFERSGYLRRSTRNLICLGLFFIGVPVRLISRLYG